MLSFPITNFLVSKLSLCFPQVDMEGENDCAVAESKACYSPITTFEELVNYGESGVLKAEDSMPIRAPCIDKTVPLNKSFGSVKVTLDGKRVKAEDCPKTLVCHDFKGGYGDDRFVDGSSDPENYVFRHWLQTDIFCYFSHHFVTIPPLGWINAAHSHGVKVLGTIITEWDDGRKLCDEMLKDSTTIDKTVAKLCHIAKTYAFEGYLVNIENELSEPQVPLMIEFLQKLSTNLKALSPDNLTIWYDSVTIDGKLKWQDSLNDLNVPFFQACDGIYLNYNWNDEKLKATVEKAGSRRFDVFVGIDVFGRGCFGGGGVNTCLAVEKIHPFNLCYAVFAPGWSFECHPYQSFSRMDDAVWTPCSNYLFFRCLESELHPSSTFELLSPTGDNSPSNKFNVYFSTDFSMGYGTKKYFFGKEPTNEPWFNLSCQSYQPALLPSRNVHSDDETKLEKVTFDTSTGFTGGGSLRIRNSKTRSDYENPLKTCPIWFPLNIQFPLSRMSVAVLAAWKSESIDHQLQIFLEVRLKNMQTKKILLGSVDHLATSVAGKYYIHLKLSNFLQHHEAGKNLQQKGQDVEFFFRKNNYDEKEVNGWRISCFLFDLDNTQTQKYSGINSIKIGAEGDISLGFLSLAQIIHYNDLQQ